MSQNDLVLSNSALGREMDESWLKRMRRNLESDYYQGDEFTRHYMGKIQRETQDWFRGILKEAG